MQIFDCLNISVLMQVMCAIVLGSKIGEGKFRQCWELKEDPALCAKLVRPNIEKRILPSLRVSVPSRVFTLINNGVFDVNQLEHDNITSLPGPIRQYAPIVMELIRDVRLSPQKILVTSRAFDYDHSPSKSLAETGPVHNEEFWNHIQHISNCMLDFRRYFSDVFHRGQNILVQKLTPTEFRPVLIDLKREGCRTYPYDVLLFLPSEQRRRFRRKLLAFKEKFDARTKIRRRSTVSSQ